nr:unnamed protein product [Spirometra erinaceieuropaei]
MAVAEFPAQSAMSEDEVEEENRPRGNNLKLWGNLTTMNLNNMIYTNIQQSPYFKSNLIELKTYHEVIDEIYYKLKGLLEHPDSPYIRGLGFMYIRYCLPPEDLWIWYAPYLDDTEVRIIC